MTYPVPTLDGIPYFPLRDGYEPYHYEDELRILPLLGRDPVLSDRNEVLQSNARGAQASTFSVLCETEAEADTLVNRWGTRLWHDDGTGAGTRYVAVTKTTKTQHSWTGTVPVWIVTLTTRTVT